MFLRHFDKRANVTITVKKVFITHNDGSKEHRKQKKRPKTQIGAYYDAQK